MACDPLREKESKEILKATNAARALQIGEKMKSLEIDEQELGDIVVLASTAGSSSLGF